VRSYVCMKLLVTQFPELFYRSISPVSEYGHIPQRREVSTEVYSTFLFQGEVLTISPKFSRLLAVPSELRVHRVVTYFTQLAYTYV
jgi:hypothetical protein